METYLAIQYLTVLMGGLTVCVSAGLMAYFRRFSQTLSKAVSWMLFGEAVSGTIFLVFAATSLTTDGLTSMPPLLQTALRWIGFIVTSGTSIHLARTLRRIQAGF